MSNPKISEEDMHILQSKAEEYEQKEKYQQEQDHFLNGDILDHVHNMVDFIQKYKLRNDKIPKVQKCKKKFNKFSIKYPFLFQKIHDDHENFSNSNQGYKDLLEMLNIRKQLMFKEIEKDDADRVIGEQFFNAKCANIIENLKK